MAYPYPNQQPSYGGYGAPPPPQQPGYGGYGAAPPPQQPGYGGAPPPQQPGYGSAPYGHPPPPPHQQPYGHAPPPHQPQYGHHAPPPPPPVAQPIYHGGHHGAPPGAPYLGVPVPPADGAPPGPPPPGFNAQAAVDAIRKATKGIGTDEKALINVLAPMDSLQVDATARQFKATVGKSLIAVLEKETSSWFEACLRAKVLGPLGYDVWLIHRACDGMGTHEDVLNETLLCRTNGEMWQLKQAYRATYGKDMSKIVEGELSMKTKRMFVMAMEGARGEEYAPLDGRMVEQDARDLQAAARGAGTDEIKICGILVSRSTAHLQAVNATYQHHFRRSIADMVQSEFSGHMKDALLYIANTALPGPPGISRDAQLIEEAMAGMGTKDERLIYRVMRAHWDRHRFEELKRAYAATQSKRGLRSRVEGETSGDYKRFLSAIVGS